MFFLLQNHLVRPCDGRKIMLFTWYSDFYLFILPRFTFLPVSRLSYFANADLGNETKQGSIRKHNNVNSHAFFFTLLGQSRGRDHLRQQLATKHTSSPLSAPGMASLFLLLTTYHNPLPQIRAQ